MSTMQLTPLALSVESFARYGDVVEHQGNDTRRVLDTPFSNESSGLRYRFTVNRLQRADTQKIQITEVERHPHSAQTFIPLSGSTRHLVVVALSDEAGKLDPATLQAFVSNGRQGVSYRTGVWHFAFTAIDSDAEVAVILGLTGQSTDTEYTTLSAMVDVTSVR